jgi:plastocyanin
VIARRSVGALAVAAAAALAVIPAASGSTKKPVHKTVKVGDFFLSPSKITVPPKSTITWKWQADNANTHDVALKQHPKGAKGFHSAFASTDFSFKRKLTVKGRYVVICTLHPYDMRQTIIVK